MLSLYLVNPVFLRLNVLNYSLKSGFVSLVCLPRSFLIVMLSFKVGFGKISVIIYSVGLHLVQLTIHKLMV
jgi:hypothetical protein